MTDFRQRVTAEVRSLFINALSFGNFDITHNVNVHERLGEGGEIKYGDDEEFNVKSARLTRKKDEDGGYKYILKITIE